MAAFALVLIVLPYTITSCILEHAYESPVLRSNLQKDIIISLAPALYVFTTQDSSLFAAEAFNLFNISSALSSINGIVVFIFLSACYISIQFIKIAFLNQRGNANLFKLFIFSAIMISAFTYSLSIYEKNIFGIQPPMIMLMIFGILGFVFLAGLHAVFSRWILIVNIGGFVTSFLETGTILDDDYFLILDLIPSVPGAFGMVIVIGSTAIAAYNFGAERGWYSPLRLFAD